MNLSETDKELIAEIVEQKLRHYKLIGEPAVDGVESEYVRCDYSKDNHVTEGKAYKVQKVTVNHIYIIDRTGAIVGYPHSYFSSITREEFDRQHSTKNVEKEWKVGEWAWLGKGKYVIGLITEINGIKATADDQNGFIVKELYINEFAKPTKEEIEQHLVKIAEKKYPVGAKVKYEDGFYYDIKKHDFKFNNPNWLLVKTHTDHLGKDYFISLYRHGKWAAEIVSEPTPKITEQKERWKITIEPFNYSPNDYRIVIACISGTVLSYNEANIIAEAIRETLKNL